MVNVAIVEDNDTEKAALKEAIERYGKERKIEFEIVCYSNAVDFLEKRHINLDIVFFDIEFSDGMNGVRAAGKFREFNQNTIIIFVTNMKKYAISGYEVGALNYILKPIKYYSFAMTIDRAMHLIKMQKTEPVQVKTGDGSKLIDSRDILYIEVMKHDVTIHTVNEVYYNYGSLSEWEKLLARYQFVRCNSSTLVNLRHLQEIHSEDIVVGGNTLRLGRSKKKQFMQSVADFLGGGGV